VRPTISSGLVITVGGGHEATNVLAHADEMLYLAKRNGRNRIETIVLSHGTQGTASDA
jgi:PleD family two-component response regulator